MPPKSRNSFEQEGRILLAISTIKNDEICNIHKAAHLYNVPHTTLQQQLNGYGFQAKQHTNSHKLT